MILVFTSSEVLTTSATSLGSCPFLGIVRPVLRCSCSAKMVRLTPCALVAVAAITSSSTTAFVPLPGTMMAPSARSVVQNRHRSRIHAPMSMAIRAVESYNAAFELEEKTAATLDKYLRHPDMIAEVCKQFDCKEAEYLGEIFQPVPYSSATPQGMPSDIEEKYFLKEQYGIANIPPVVMFNAKIFKPSRLCAVYRIDGMSDAAREVMDERISRLRENEKRKKEEEELESEWDDIGSSFTEAFNMPVGSDDEDVDLDSMVV